MFVYVSATWPENDWTEINFTKWMLSYLFPLTGCRCLPYHLPHIGGVSSRVIFSLIVSLIKDTKSKNKLCKTPWAKFFMTCVTRLTIRPKTKDDWTIEPWDPTWISVPFALIKSCSVLRSRETLGTKLVKDYQWILSSVTIKNLRFSLFETFKQILNQHASSWVNKYLVLNRFRL